MLDQAWALLTNLKQTKNNFVNDHT
jgi:hypothetical protein